MLVAIALQVLEHVCDDQRRHDARHVQPEQHQPLQIEQPPHLPHRDERADQQRIHGQPRRARHQRCHENRHQPVARVLNRARGHHAGNRARKTRQQRNERAPRQPRARHQPVEQEGRARQIARFFQRQDEKEQDQDLRQEHQHAARAGDDAVHQQALQHAVWHDVADPHAHGFHGPLDALHERLRPREHRLEHEEHQHGQQHQAQYRMQHDTVEPVVQLGGAARHGHGGIEQALHFNVRIRIHREPDRHGRQLFVVDMGDKVGRAIAFDGHGLHHGHAQSGFQLGPVDSNTAPLGCIHHVQRQHHRQAQALQFQHETQVQPQVSSVDHADQQVGTRLAAERAEADITRDGFVRAGGDQAVGAGQIENLHMPARRRSEAAFLALDRHARVVCDLLAAARQQVEQRGLPAVGVADQGNAQCGGGSGGRRSVHLHEAG